MIFKKINFPFFPPIPRNYNENDFSLRPPITVIRFGSCLAGFFPNASCIYRSFYSTHIFQMDHFMKRNTCALHCFKSSFTFHDNECWAWDSMNENSWKQDDGKRVFFSWLYHSKIISHHKRSKWEEWLWHEWARKNVVFFC